MGVSARGGCCVGEELAAVKADFVDDCAGFGGCAVLQAAGVVVVAGHEGAVDEDGVVVHSDLRTMLL